MEKTERIILGIDPGYATIGFGLIEGERAQYRMVTYGAITTPAGLPLSKRLYQIDRDMDPAMGHGDAGGDIRVEEQFLHGDHIRLQLADKLLHVPVDLIDGVGGS